MLRLHLLRNIKHWEVLILMKMMQGNFSCIFILTGCRHLIILQHLKNPPGSFLYCTLWITTLWASSLCSTLFILSMTFERFYSIIRPHKSASVNTVYRAKITIVCILILSIFFNIPHLKTTLQVNRQCVPFGRSKENLEGQVYYWLSLVINFFLPFVLLLTMNTVIIHTLRTRLRFNNIAKSLQGQSTGQGQDKGESQSSKMKSAERQIYITLLSVTFGFLILNAPAYSFFVYVMYQDFRKSPYAYAVYFLFNNAARQAYYTNFGINFFLYVISGRKFRVDLMKLFECRRESPADASLSDQSNTQVSTVFSSWKHWVEPMGGGCLGSANPADHRVPGWNS